MILESIPLRIIIEENHCHHQIDFLSFHLTFHVDQVISLKIHDTIRDYSSTISLLFNQHYFINLESCIFISINRSTKLENVIKQIQSLNRLVSFAIYQPNYKNLNENDTYEFTRTILMHKSSSLRSILLHYPYDYSYISNYISITSHLISLSILISSSPSNISVYSILPVLRHCHTVRDLHIIVEHNDLIENNNLNASIQTSSMNDNDLPILSQMMSFNLIICATCDNRSIACILRCMPNLIHFYFHLAIRKTTWSFPDELLDGYVWKQMLEVHVPYLSKFEFHMSIAKKRPKLDLDIVVNSFEYFVRKYSNWHMIINRWIFNRQIKGHSLDKFDGIYLDIIHLVNSRHTTVTDDDAQENINHLLQFVYLPNVTQIEFGSTFNIYRWKDIELILKACPNVINIIISTSILISSEVFDNPALLSIFKQIKMIKSTMKNDYFPSNLASKFVEHFPSLSHIELQVLSFENCVSIIDIFLNNLKYLSYIKMNYDEALLINDLISSDYIIEKRCQAFPMNIFDKQLIDIENNGETIEIWLS